MFHARTHAMEYESSPPQPRHIMSRAEVLGLKIMGLVRSEVDGHLQEDYPPPPTETEVPELRAHFKDLCVPGAAMVPLYMSETDPSLLTGQQPAIVLAVEQGHRHVQRFGGEHPQGSMHVTGELLRFLVEECGNNVNGLYESDDATQRGTLLSRALVMGTDGERQSERAGAVVMRHLLRLGANPNAPFELHNKDNHKNNGHSLLHVAFTLGGLGLAEVLLESGARFSQTVDPPGAMAFAMQRNSCADTLELCARFKTQLTRRDVAAEGVEGGTALHWLARTAPSDQRRTEDLLYTAIEELRISPHTVDAQGQTAKDVAQTEVRALAQYGGGRIHAAVMQRTQMLATRLEGYMRLETSRLSSVAAQQALRSSLRGGASLPMELQQKVYGHVVQNNTHNFMRSMEAARALETRARATVAERARANIKGVE